jgi:2,4-dienoyl-CoA reductase-like NADH-dependent reductase (Old Yellow Enzyme family)
LAPSPVEYKKHETIPKEMDEQDIKEVIQAFGKGAERAKKAGFDGVQLHGAHGYLLCQFLSPYLNQREDRWGGSTENRCRIIKEIIQVIRSSLGDDFPIIIKINGDDCYPGGIDLNESINIAKTLESYGIDGLEVSGGIGDTEENMTIRLGINSIKDEGYYKDYAAAIKKEVNIPVLLVGGLRSETLMEDIISKNEADFISLSRPFVREPDLVKSFRLGKKYKSDCISCNGCFNFRGTVCSQI